MPKIYQELDGNHEERTHDEAMSILGNGSGPIFIVRDTVPGFDPLTTASDDFMTITKDEGLFTVTTLDGDDVIAISPSPSIAITKAIKNL